MWWTRYTKGKEVTKYHIIGAGLTGAVIASQLGNDQCLVIEKNKVGGLCIDNDKYQEYVHIFHTDKPKIWDFINKYTDVRLYRHYVKSFVNGKLKAWIPPEITEQVIQEQMTNYGIKMWRSEAPKEALMRISPKTATLFDGEWQGIPNFRKLFANLLKGKEVVKENISFVNNIKGQIILTGAIDEYYNYCYGELPYRGMKSCHCQSEQGLEVGVINFPNDFPFVRMIDYQRLGYQNYIGFEFPSNDKHYPVNNKTSIDLYNKYKALAEKDNIILAGRLGLYKYMDMDDCIENALEIIKGLTRK